MTSVANKVKANPPISQKGTYGYLLWLRRDMPVAYAKVVQQVPAVAQFEAALPKASAGLGDDFDFSVSDTDVSEPDVSSFDLTPDNTVDISSLTSGIDAPISFDSSDLFPPTVNPPSDVTPSAASTAASAASSVLPTIAQIVASAAPVAAAVINNATAKTNQATVAKANQTAALQYAAAVQGAAPLQTGLVTTAQGTTYIAPLNALSGSLSAGLSSAVLGVPIWVWALGGLGAVALVLAASSSE